MIKLLETKPDPTLKDFFTENERFADLINVICFNGRDVIDSSNIERISNEESTLFEDEDVIRSFASYRDILIRYCKEGIIALIGLENQQRKDTLISLREYLYAAFNYNIQYRNYQRDCRKRLRMGMKTKKFELVPVITPVLYYGEDFWCGDYYLHELMPNLPEEWKELINDWHTRVVDIKKIDKSLFRNKDNRDLFDGIVKVYECKGDISKLQHMKVSKDVAILISTITGMKELVNVIRIEEREEIDMCRSWEIFKERVQREADEMAALKIAQSLDLGMKQGIEQGIEQGIKQGIQKGLFEGKSNTILSLLNQKLGNLSLSVQYKIENSSMDKLDLLVENLFTIENEQDILNIVN